MGACKLYAIYGNSYQDFLLYLSAVLQNCGLKILIADFKEEILYSEAMPEYNWGLRIINHRGVDYTRISLDKEVYKGYDIIFVVPKQPFEEEEYAELEALFLISDFQYKNVSMLKPYLMNKKDYILVLRDYINPKIRLEYLYESIFLQNPAYQECYIIPFDHQDYSYRMKLGYDSILEFMDLSKEFRTCIMDCAAKISGVPPRELKKYYNKAKRGNIRC